MEFNGACGVVIAPLRRDFWNNLADAVRSGLSFCVCIGNFNDLLIQNKKFGGREVSNRSHSFLKNFLEDLGGLDLGYHGNTYTWCNGRGGIANIGERLDRVVANFNWRVVFDNAGVVHFSAANFDHIPIMLNLSLDHKRIPRPLHFLNAWSRDPYCEQTIKKTWNSYDPPNILISLTRKKRNTTKALTIWNRESFSFCNVKIHELENLIALFQSIEPSYMNLDRLKEA